MKRHLLITIDANHDTCADCEFRLLVVGGRMYCEVFGVDLGAQKPPDRAKVCLDAERAAKGASK